MKRGSSSQSLPILHLALGLAVFVVMTLALGEIAEDVRNREPLILIDSQLTSWLHTNAGPHLTTWWWAITSIHASLPVAMAALAVGIYLWLRREFYWVAAVWLSVYGGMLLNWILKLSFQRARPSFSDPILTLTSYSFPSGHTMMATTLYGVVAAYLVSRTTNLAWRIGIILLAGLMIALVGFSRIYLGAHYLSDVLGAIAEGLAWMSLCLTAVYSVWLNRKSS